MKVEERNIKFQPSGESDKITRLKKLWDLSGIDKDLIPIYRTALLAWARQKGERREKENTQATTV